MFGDDFGLAGVRFELPSRFVENLAGRGGIEFLDQALGQDSPGEVVDDRQSCRNCVRESPGGDGARLGWDAGAIAGSSGRAQMSGTRTENSRMSRWTARQGRWGLW